MRTLRILGIAFSLLQLGLPPLSAQTIRGVLVEEGTERPIPNTLVVLLDPSGRQHGGSLTDESGRYLLRAPAPGRYLLRAERIGYQSTTSHPLEVAAGETVEHRIVASAQIVGLEGIRVEGRRRRCSPLTREAGLETVALWEEARKALNTVAWTRQQRLFDYQVLRYQRDVDPATLQVKREQTRSRSGLSENPFVSASADTLAREGYVRRTASGTTYHAPDAHVFLSDAFLGSHCFRIERKGAERDGLIGLAFEPVRGRTLPDIRGVLWLDAKTAELRHLEYRYTGLSRAVPTERLGGRVEFERLPTGAWIVRRWWIRMPQVGVQQVRWSGTTATREVLLGFREEGGEVVGILGAEPSRSMASRRVVLEGMVYDSVLAAPLAGATVFLPGTPYSAVTDASGRFRLEELPEGRYSLSFSHPRWESLGTGPPTQDVFLRSDRTEPVNLATPGAAALIASLCDGSRVEIPEGFDARGGMVYGVVRDPRTGKPLPHAAVTLSWSRFNVGVAGVRENRQRATTYTDRDGRYRVCGVPPEVTVRVRAASAPRSAGEVTFTLPPNGLREQELVGEENGSSLAEGEAVALDPLTVTAPTKDRRERLARGTRTAAITREEIEPLLGRARHAGDLLRTLNVAGLTVRDDVIVDGIRGLCIQSGRIRAGGNGCRMMEVYLNGIRLSVPQHQLLNVSPADIDRVEILPPVESGARYGTGSARGVLRIYTRGSRP
jgi:hypothetical protein